MQGTGIAPIRSNIMNFKNENERVINYAVIEECKRVTRGHPQAIKCLEAIWNRLFKYGIEVLIDGKIAKLKQETIDHMNKQFVPWCREFMLCYYEMGVVPASVCVLPNGDKIPVIMQDQGIITVYMDPIKNRGKKFRFYKIASNKGVYNMAAPRRDKNTYIFSGYGYDPDLSGNIRSIVASAIPWVIFSNKMLSCAYKAEERNTQPDIYTEVVDPQLIGGEKSMGTSVDINMWWGDRWRANEDAQIDRIQINQQQFNVAQNLNGLYADRWNKEIGGDMMYMKTKSTLQRPRPMPITPLPVGHRVAGGIPRPQSRGDILEINYREEEVISSIFGVPRSLFNAEVRTVGGVQANSEMLVETLMAWRKRLSEAMTLMFKCIYEEEICELFENEVKEEVKKRSDRFNDTEDKSADVTDEFLDIVKNVVKHKAVQVQLPVVPYDNSEDIWNHMIRGVISYGEFVRFSKMTLGLPVSESDNNARPPWEDSNSAFSVMNSLGGGMNQQTNKKGEDTNKVKKSPKSKDDSNKRESDDEQKSSKEGKEDKEKDHKKKDEKKKRKGKEESDKGKKKRQKV